MQFSRIFSATLLAALLAACTTTPPEKPTEPQKTQIVFKKVDFSALPTMPDQNWEPALEALKISCRKMSAQAGWEDVCAKASRTTAFEAKEFFLENFTPYQSLSQNTDAQGNVSLSDTGKMTGYYEPILYGSRTKKPRMCTPCILCRRT